MAAFSMRLKLMRWLAIRSLVASVELFAAFSWSVEVSTVFNAGVGFLPSLTQALVSSYLVGAAGFCLSL